MLSRLILILSILIIAPRAFAVDPFLSDTDDDGTYVDEVRKTRDQADQNLQPNRAQLLGRSEDELAPPKDLREKHQNRQKDHPGHGARDIQIDQA